MSEVVIKLKEPIVKTGKTSGEVLVEITELRLRRPKARDLQATDKATGNIERVLALAASLTGEPVSLLGELCVEDFQAVAAALEVFFPNSPQIGPM